jgi:hypothetical protein
MPTYTLDDLALRYYARQLGVNLDLPSQSQGLATGPDAVGTPATLNVQNTAPTGSAPANSATAMSVNGRATAAFQLTANTLNVGLILQASIDGVTWFPVGGNVFLRQSDGALLSSIPAGAVGAFTVACSDFQNVRLSTPNTALTGSATVLSSASATPTIFTYDNAVLAPAATVSNPAGFVLVAATNQQLLAANPARRRAIIRNDSGQPVFIRFGSGAATASQYTTQIASGSLYEVPDGITAAVQAFSTLAGAAPGILVTELTA